jgi:hypothetical protein
MIHPGWVIGDPFTNLLAISEVPRTHFGAVLPEPLPITVHAAVSYMAFTLNAAVFVIFNMFLCHH